MKVVDRSSQDSVDFYGLVIVGSFFLFIIKGFFNLLMVFFEFWFIDEFYVRVFSIFSFVFYNVVSYGIDL